MSARHDALGLDADQVDFLDERLRDWSVVEDLSWPLGVTTLRLRSGEADFVTKASAANPNIAREIEAYRFLGDALAGRIPRFVDGDPERGILLVGYLEGVLAEGSPAEEQPAFYAQAGRLLRRLHRPAGDPVDPGPLRDRVGALLEDARGLVPDEHRATLEERLDSIPTAPFPLVFTHGDWQPRNWLVHRGRLRAIDLGRGAPRHWTHDVVRLEHQQFLARPVLRTAFYAGYGGEPRGRDRAMLLLEELAQALGTVTWAHAVGDAPFEEHGRRMVRRIAERDPARDLSPG